MEERAFNESNQHSRLKAKAPPQPRKNKIKIKQSYI
jgi:hypothetical protein